jgi:hypothetical protein
MNEQTLVRTKIPMREPAPNYSYKYLIATLGANTCHGWSGIAYEHEP